MTSSIWPEAPDSQTQPLRSNLEAPIVIVGAGISGLTTAYELARTGRRPVIIDAAKPAAGETHYTSAHLASVIDDRFVNMERWHGEQGSRLAYQSHATAITWIEHTIQDLGIECDFARINGYLFDPGVKGKDFLEKELEAAWRAGFVQAQLLDITPLRGLTEHPCICFPNQARFNPGLYINGLLRELERMEVPIYRDARVLSWEAKDGVRLKTDNDFEVNCEKVVFACNDPFVRFKYYTMHAPYRSYVMTFEVPENIESDGLYWDTSDPYHYLRFAKNPKGPGRVLVSGGEDHKTGQKEHAEECWKNLEGWTRYNLPWTGRETARWSGQILETIDGLAFLGQDPGGEGKVLMISGDSGMGLTHGTIGALIVSALLEGKTHPWTELYDPGRFRWKAFPQFVQENANVARQYTHVMLPSLHAQTEATEDHGVVVQAGLGKSACVRDGNECKEMNAICPHLGGLVTWNEAEGTWDCQCHGSRFTAEGEVINGPAVTPLKLKNKERVKNAKKAA